MSLGWHIDESLELNEEIRFKQKYKQTMLEITKNSHFSFQEVERIMLIYYKILKCGSYGTAGISRKQLRDVLHYGLNLTDYRMMDSILANIDKGVNPFVSMINWGKILSLYLRGTMEEKIQYCFDVYTGLSVESALVRNNIIKLLKHSLIKEGSEEDDEGVKDMVDLIIKKMDYDRDGKLSFEDYRQAVLDQPLLLEAFGPALPSRLATHAFITTFTCRVGKL